MHNPFLAFFALTEILSFLSSSLIGRYGNKRKENRGEFDFYLNDQRNYGTKKRHTEATTSVSKNTNQAIKITHKAKKLIIIDG